MLNDSDLFLAKDLAVNGTTDVVSDSLPLPDTKMRGAIMFLVIKIKEAFTGDATVIRFALTSCATSGGSYTATGLERTYTDVAQLPVGKTALIGAVPQDALKFLQILLDPNGSTGLTAGAFDAYLTPHPDGALA